MEGRTDPGVKNYLREKWSLHQRVEAEEVMRSLMEHPGWALMDEIVEAHAERGEANLAKLARETAMAVDMQKRIDFARKDGVQNGITFHRDVVASVLDSAKTAAAELKRTAALDEAAERS